jgi:uncharacterized phage protein (TIGR02218 family)
MKAAPTGLATLLATGVFVTCDLYQFALGTGQTLYYTTADTDVLWAGHTYVAYNVLFDSFNAKSQAHWKIGLDVDTWQVRVAPLEVDAVTGALSPAQIGNQPWLAAAVAGALDGAVVDIHRAYWAAWPTPWRTPFVPDYVLQDVFAGTVAAVDVMLTSGLAVISINSFLDNLTRAMPRNLYQSGCRHALFDTGCSLVRSSFAFASFADTGTTQSSIVPHTALPTVYSYKLGSIQFTSGANAGFSRMIKDVVSGALLPNAPFPFTIGLTDTFNAYPGCDKTIVTCINNFGNRVNFGGHPNIPTPETAI